MHTVAMLVSAGLLLPLLAGATEVKLAWTQASKTSQGTAIPANAPVLTRIYYGPTAHDPAKAEGFSYPNKVENIVGGNTAIQVPGGQKWCFAVTTYTKDPYTWKDAAGKEYKVQGESPLSNPLCKDVAAETPTTPPPDPDISVDTSGGSLTVETAKEKVQIRKDSKGDLVIQRTPK